MAKRKAGVHDIIYELDNEDSELSSEDEVKQRKIIRIEKSKSPNTSQDDSNTQSSRLEVIDIDSSTEKIDETRSPKSMRNGGKSPVEFIIIDEVSETASPRTPSNIRNKKLKSDTIIINEDIIVDSPASYSDTDVVGCENRTPLVTVKFKDNKLAMTYKKQIKAFMLNLIKLHENSQETDNETDLELDIWPEDLEDFTEEADDAADNLFFIDTDPNGDDMPVEIPSYSQNTALICNAPEKAHSPPPMLRRKGPVCFNCNGSHTMRECREPWNNARIAENKKALIKKGRYHVEDEQKYGHLVPGRISGKLRHALGLSRHELPLHVYRMRQLGYPPGWLEEARISHSGITLFDSSGQAILDPEDEEGELCEPGSKDKFDIKKIHDFPGFNVPASSRYKEEADVLGLPPMSDADSKLAMLAVLTPNAMQAYKRKKLTLFPGAAPDRALAGTAEMDIDSGDEIADFPSQPPLPDDAPPPLPPPPDAPPPPDTPPLPPPEEPVTKSPPLKKETTTSDAKKPEAKNESDDDLQVVEVLKVSDIPVPFAEMITIDVDGDVSEPGSRSESPSLDDLEQKKRLLLDALNTDEPIEYIADNLENDEEKDDNDTKNTKGDTVVSEPIEITMDAKTEGGSQTELASDVEIVDENIEGSNDKPDEKVEDGSCDNGIISGVVIDKVDKEVETTISDKSTSTSTANDKQDVESTISDNLSTANDKQDVTTVSDKEPVTATSDDKQAIASSDTEVASTSDRQAVESISNEKSPSAEGTPKVANEPKSTDTELMKTPTSMGLVRGTEYGTPVINVASPYVKLPSDDKFAKDICDVINFENLPNSIGKYKKISTLLKKVKSEVDRIQES